MKVHGCASCGARFPTYAGLQEHLLTHSTICRTCNRTFTRRADLLTHKCVTADRYSCESCRSTFSTRCKLKRHLRDTSCSQSLPPEPKRQRMSAHEEDPDNLTKPPPQQDPIYKTCLHNTGQVSVRTWREVQFKQDIIIDLKIIILGR